MKSCTPAIPHWFPKKWLFGFFILEKQLASQNLFLVKSQLSLTTYLFLVFFSNIGIGIRRGWWWTENSTWTPWFSSPRENNVFSYSREFSGKRSYILHPSLDPYRRRNTLILVGLATLTGSSRLILVGLGNLWFLQVHLLCVGWRNFFSSCQFLVLEGNRFWFYILTYAT